jgi:hypothetical protein
MLSAQAGYSRLTLCRGLSLKRKHKVRLLIGATSAGPKNYGQSGCYADFGFVIQTARTQASQNTKKKQARNTGKLVVADQCSTVRPTI